MLDKFGKIADYGNTATLHNRRKSRNYAHSSGFFYALCASFSTNLRMYSDAVTPAFCAFIKSLFLLSASIRTLMSASLFPYFPRFIVILCGHKKVFLSTVVVFNFLYLILQADKFFFARLLYSYFVHVSGSNHFQSLG